MFFRVVLFLAFAGVVEGMLPAVLIAVTSLAQGLIGFGGMALSRARQTYLPRETTGCRWVDSAPWWQPRTCRPDCDSQDVVVRYSAQYNKETDENGYGHYCIGGEKAYCCTSNAQDPTWGGRWQSGMLGMRYICKYHSYMAGYLDKTITRNYCGYLQCYTKHPKKGLPNRSLGTINGDRCNVLRVYDMEGMALNGLIIFRYKNGTVQDQWYK